MTAVVRALLEVTIYAAVLYGAIALFRRLLGAKAGPRLRLALWALLVLRLLLPVTWESPVHPFALSAPPAQAARPSAAPTVAPAQPSLPAGLPAQAVAAVTRPTAQPPGWLPDEDMLPLSAPVAPQPTPRRPDWRQALLALWLAGALASVGVFAAQALGLRRQLRGAAAPDDRLRGLLAGAQNALGLHRGPRLLITGEGSPALTVHPRPALLLPAWMTEQLSDRELTAALRHELTHYRHGHHWMALALIALRCAYWFHPCVWLMARGMREDMELACDAAVVAAMGMEDRRAYAQTLLTLYGRSPQPRLAVAMAGSARRTAELRIRGVFQPARTAPAARLAALALAAVLVSGCFTTACQPTPAKPAVIQKDGAALMEAIDKGNRDAQNASLATPGASGIPARYADIPATWQDTATAKPYPIQVEINARVTVPTADKLPVYVVRAKPLAQENIDGFLAVFGQAPYHLLDYGGTKTRSDYANMVVEQQKYLSSIDGNEDYTAAQKEQFKKETRLAIQRFQKAMLSAPEALDDVIEPAYTNKYLMQGAEQPDREGDDQRSDEQLAADAKENLKKLGLEEVSVQWEKDGTKMYLHSYRSGLPAHNSLTYTVGQEGTSGFAAIDGQGDIKYLSMTYDQARSLAEKAATALGLDYLTITRTAKVIDYGSEYRYGFDRGIDSFTDFGQVPYTERSYVFGFTRSVDGVCETYAYNGIDCSAGYAEVVPYERMEIIVNGKGIESLSYSCPTELGEQLSADVKLLDFEQVRSIALDQFTRGNLKLGMDYPAENERVAKWFVRGQVWIDNVTLGYARVKLGDGSDRYALVPAWDFFGYWAIRKDANDPDDPSEPFNEYSAGQDMRRFSVLTINAVDGSIIDRSKGY